LVNIWLTIAEHDPAAADRVFDRIEARIAVLGTFPEAGVARPDIAPEARMLVEPPYLILYRQTEGVQIVRVLHGARDVGGAHFAEGIE
jgi:toxin ParE1/3/4